MALHDGRSLVGVQQKDVPTVMTFPILLTAKVTIAYRADDGYSSEVCLGDLLKKSDPKQVLLEAHRETARLLSLFGYETDARATADEAHAAVANDFLDMPGFTRRSDVKGGAA